MKKLIYILILTFLTTLSYSASYRGKLIAEDRHITVDFKEMELADVIRIVARKFDLNLIAGKEVKGTVTVSFKNVLVDDALESMLSINGYTYVKVGSIIKVIPYNQAEMEFDKKEIKMIEEKKEEINMVNKVYKLENIEAETVKKKLTEIIKKGDKLITEERSNKLIVWVEESELKLIDNLIEALDREDMVKEKEVVEIITIKYIDPVNLLSIIKKIYDYKGEIFVNVELKSMIIKSNQTEIDNIKELINNFDIPPLQVTIEANLVEVSRGDDKNQGINWNYINPKQGTTGNNFDILVGDEDIAGRTDDGITIKLGMLDFHDFNMILKDLLENTNANLLSSPIITTLNNKTASIHLGDKVPYKENQAEDEGVSYKFETVGIKLEVTPEILEDGKINMKVKPEVSSVTEYTPDNVPIISTRMAETNVIIEDGETLVIGGLIKNEEIETITSVPILGNIPIIGNLFKSKSKKNNKINLMVFITPRILKTRELQEVILFDKNIANENKMKEKLKELKENGIKMDELKKIIGGESN